jgi:pimeloyl-ACP methyl ester carboxylesterase
MSPWPGQERYARTVHLPKNKLALHVYDAGAGPAAPMLLIHGLGDEADTWRHLIMPLSADRRIVALDLPGFGRSDKPKQPYTLSFFQDVVIELLDALSIQRAILVGHSLGAIIAHWTALNHPERLKRVILVDGSLVVRSQKTDTATLLFLIPGLGEWLYTRLRRDPQAAYQTLASYYERLDELPPADRDFLFQRVNERVWSDGQRRAFFATFRHLARWLPGQQRDVAARLSTLDVPTLVIWGEADRINSIENGRALAKLQPTTHLAVVPGAGHNAHQENPAAVLRAIQAWMASG